MSRRFERPHVQRIVSVKQLDRLFYHDYLDNWDDLLFRERVLSVLKPQHTILDLGAGTGLVKHMNFRGRCKAVYGLDPHPGVLANPYLDHPMIGTAEEIPTPSGTFDLIFADNVLEHLAEPAKAFKEIYRSLKPGGVFLAKTPNRFHYVPLLAQITPTRFHQFINRLRGRDPDDTFPTFYRANSKSKLVALSGSAGLTTVAIEQIEGRPEYMRINFLLYVFGLAWERFLNSTDWLSNIRILLIAAFKKPHLVNANRNP